MGILICLFLVTRKKYAKQKIYRISWIIENLRSSQKWKQCLNNDDRETNVLVAMSDELITELTAFYQFAFANREEMFAGSRNSG